MKRSVAKLPLVGLIRLVHFILTLSNKVIARFLVNLCLFDVILYLSPSFFQTSTFHLYQILAMQILLSENLRSNVLEYLSIISYFLFIKGKQMLSLYLCLLWYCVPSYVYFLL